MKDCQRNILVMGIINATDDSYYPPNRVIGTDGRPNFRKLAEVLEGMLTSGADIIDIGGCSTRPGSISVSAETEWERLKDVLPFVRKVAGPGVPISIDTFNSKIIERAFGLIGPVIVNDISAGMLDKDMLLVAGRLGLTYIAMHMKGSPETMTGLTSYDDIMAEITSYFKDFEERADAAGITDWWLDPGFGFSKTVLQNYTVLRNLDSLLSFNRPILAGISRKSMIYKLLGKGPEDVLAPTQALHMAALERGATILRVHDVSAAKDTVSLYKALKES